MPDITPLNKNELKRLAGDFLMQYPQGFMSPEMIEIGKKHNVEKMTLMAQDMFKRRACANIHVTGDNMIKVVSRSSMISMFEKPKFKAFINNLSENDKAYLVNSLSQFLHAKNQKKGFESLVDILQTEKLAKWSLLTIIPAYFSPQIEVFIKPTTTKRVLKHFAMSSPVYHSTPTWDFYEQYRYLMNTAKKEVDASLSPSNPAFSGFLMMSVNS